jgi:hypothetical protein
MRRFMIAMDSIESEKSEREREGRGPRIERGWRGERATGFERKKDRKREKEGKRISLPESFVFVPNLYPPQYAVVVNGDVYIFIPM